MPFTKSGDTEDNTVFEFPETAGNVPLNLRTVVRQYVGTQHVRMIPSKKLLMTLGRLRCLNHALRMYNDGVVSPNPAFLQYWRRRTLNLLSGFGFQIQNAEQQIVIPGLKELIQAVEQVHSHTITAARDMIKGKLVTFDALGELYCPDVPVLGRTGLPGTQAVFMVTDYFYEERRSLMGMEQSFHLSMDFIANMGQHFSVVSFTEVLSGWMGVRARSFSDLTYFPLDPSDAGIMQERGQKYANFGVGGAQFLSYKSNSFFLHYTGASSSQGKKLAGQSGAQLQTGGRIMIDPARGAALGHHASQNNDEPSLALVQLSGRYRRCISSRTESNAGAANMPWDAMYLWESVPTELCIYCWPALVGFSFTAKSWGHVLVDGLEAIKFHDHAFDRLVLSEERKQLLRALIQFGDGPGSDDIVAGKNSGTIILLHGPPGVGKTLTAEAIAEVLHRPLYYVTMGELGMTPSDMENRLSDVLDLCAGWDAITLLDEADVFLETRDTNDLVRNALVCVMLRLLEYHPGILFLTTNRVRSFDPAVESRVTVALRYDHLTAQARSKIWENLLENVPIPLGGDVSTSELGKHEMNGRQIKNAVRLAVALARERGTAMTTSVLNLTMQVTNLGREEMSTDDSWKGK